MEHVQPLERPSPLRSTTLAVAVVLVMAAATVGGIALLQQIERTGPQQTRPVPGTGRVPTGQVAAAAPLLPRSRVAVLVLNGNGVSGAAGGEASRLLGRGYRHTSAVNASASYATSVVLFRPGREREAERLARDAKIRMVAPLDGSLPPADDGYQLVLVLGAK